MSHPAPKMYINPTISPSLAGNKNYSNNNNNNDNINDNNNNNNYNNDKKRAQTVPGGNAHARQSSWDTGLGAQPQRQKLQDNNKHGSRNSKFRKMVGKRRGQSLTKRYEEIIDDDDGNDNDEEVFLYYHHLYFLN